jgi:hypothetical protein
MGVMLTTLADEALGRVAFTVLVLGAILLDKRFGQQGQHGTLIGVDERSPQPLGGVGHPAMALVLCQTRVPMDRVCPTFYTRRYWA